MRFNFSKGRPGLTCSRFILALRMPKHCVCVCVCTCGFWVHCVDCGRKMTLIGDQLDIVLWSLKDVLRRTVLCDSHTCTCIQCVLRVQYSTESDQIF